MRNPAIGFDPGTRATMFGQYAELVKENYQSNGNMGLAKRQAADTLKKTWGVSEINGKSVVMQYPPERAPAYAGVENLSAGIAKQAQDAVKGEAGYDVERSTIGTTKGLVERFGPSRVRNTPISEAGVLGACTGRRC